MPEYTKCVVVVVVVVVVGVDICCSIVASRSLPPLLKIFKAKVPLGLTLEKLRLIRRCMLVLAATWADSMQMSLHIQCVFIM